MTPPSNDVLAEAVAVYKRLLLYYLDQHPDADDDDLLSMLDDAIPSELPREEDLATQDPPLFAQVLADEVPIRRWESMGDLPQRPTIGWMISWVVAEHVRFRAHDELRADLAADPTLLARVESIGSKEYIDHLSPFRADSAPCALPAVGPRVRGLERPFD